MGASFLDQAPVRIGTAEEFASVAKALRDAPFDEETICRTLKLEDMSDVGSVDENVVDFSNVSPQFQVLVRLFLCLSLVPRSEISSVFDEITLNAFLSLGLLGTGDFGQDDFYARVLLYPVANALIASDRHSLPDGTNFEPPDVVFPAIYVGTLRFLKLLPTSGAGQALDLCAGTGIGALVLSRTCRQAASADVTERATQFARFNRALNSRDNVDVVCGDLYGAVGGRTFDLIVAHPPYVPSVGLAAIWRDGGVTGELLIRQIVEGLPGHLRTGGIFCALSQGLDTKEGRFEERVSGWLKESADEFDTIFAYDEERTPRDVLQRLAQRNQAAPPAALKALEAEFERVGILKLPYGALFMRRNAKSADRKPWTVRKKLSDETNGSDFEASFVLHDRLSQPGFAAELLEARPQLAPRLQVKVTYVVHERALAPAQYMFEIDKPFTALAQFEAWMVPLLTRLDGQTTLTTIYEEARAQAQVPESFAIEDFVGLVSGAITLGYVVLAEVTPAGS